MSDDPHVRLNMLSNPLYLGGARELVTAVARGYGFSPVASAQVALAVDEALCNVIRHGYDRRDDQPIILSIWPASDPSPGIRITIEDEARQIDPDKIKGRDLADIRPGGLGVHIIREVMDDVRYEKRPGAGMRLSLLKLLNGKVFGSDCPSPQPAPVHQ